MCTMCEDLRDALERGSMRITERTNPTLCCSGLADDDDMQTLHVGIHVQRPVRKPSQR